MTHKFKNRVILFNPLPGKEKGHRGAPLSLLSIAAPLHHDGYNIKIVDANVDDDYAEKVSSSLDEAICVGITCMTGFQIAGALKMAKLVKERMPDMPVIFGGWHATILPEEVLKNKLVDIIIRGQGDNSFGEVVKRLKAEKSLEGVKGVSCKNLDKIVTNENRCIEDMNDTYPMPYHLLDDIEKYIYSDWYGERILSYISSFGCPHNCGFCAEHNMSHGRWKGLSSDRVIREVSALVDKYNLDGIALYDSNFFVNEKRVKEICKGMKKKIKWGNANGSAKVLLRYSPDSWQAMEDGGFSEILIGAESGDNEILEFISKGAVAEDVIKLKKVSNKYNIKLWISLMLGIPFDLGDSKKSLKREFKACTSFVRELYNIGRGDRYALFLYTPYPGTSLFDFSLANGVEVPKELEGWSGYDLNTANVPWLNKGHFQLADFLGNFIFLHSRPPKERGHEFNRQPMFKRIYLNVCYRIASFRIKHNFYRFSIEFMLIRFAKFIIITYRRKRDGE